MQFGIITTTLDTVAKVINQAMDIANYSNTRSMSEVTKLTRVEPLTIISKDCLNLEYIADVNQALLSIFSGYYLQAVSLISHVSDVDVVRLLDSLNPDRDETGFLLDKTISRESIRNILDDSYTYSLPTSRTLALEADTTAANKSARLNINVKNSTGGGSNGGKSLDTAITTINEVSNLSVGKMLNVEISYTAKGKGDEGAKERSVKIPVNVRLMVSVIPNSTIAHIITMKTEDIGIVERFHAWRAGRISFIKDLIFCQDLIDEHKKSLISDESGTIQEIMRRVNNSKKYGLLSRNPSLVSASNIFVISEEVARDIESKLGGKLSNPRIRQKAFDNTYAMIIAVVDREWERVTFYTRGISASTDLSIKEIKAANKGKGPDITDIMKSMQMGLAPSF